MTKVICITGCCGFIGSYITRTCLKMGWYVLGIDKLTYAADQNTLTEFSTYGERFKFVKSDINELQSLPDVDYVVNCAAETHVDNSIVSSQEFLDSNINGVHHLLELIRKKGLFKMPVFLHFSTDETYGDISTGSHTETDLLKPSNPYSATKAAADMLILAWNRTFKVPYIIVRPTNNYGCGQYVEKLIPKACKYIQLKRKIPLHNNGTPRRIWLHAQDTANAIIAIILSGNVNEIYNISGNVELSNIEVVKLVYSSFLTKDGKLLYEGWENDVCDFSYHREGQDVRYSLDDAKLRRMGWTNLYKLDSSTISGIVDYYRSNYIW